ncbi:TPA: hypothetical protein K8M77_000289 [Clostridium perfringens]|nr:hypothetical protein [Clostridium perfringens]
MQDTPPIEERKQIIEALNEEHFQEVGEQLPSYLLEMLGTWLLKETYSDKRTNKVAVEEFPILSESQILRRRRKVVQIECENALEILNYHLRNNSSTSKRNEETKGGRNF